ncbi:MAG: response regulator [Myxococcota bacterium]
MDGERGQSRPALLVVDDEERILSALRRALRKEGYEIVTAETPEAALRILGERRFDAVLSDHKMPGMSGMQLLARARELQPELVLLLITGWTEEIPRDRLTQVGVRALITKPWDDARLKATLRRCLATPPPSQPSINC